MPSIYKPYLGKGNALRTSWLILGVFTVAAAFVFGVIVSGKLDANSTPLVTSVLGFAGLILMQLVTGQRVETRVQDVDAKVERVLNGEFDRKIQTNVRDAIEDHEDNKTVTITEED